MTFDPKRYPANWKALRAATLVRAGNACECRGECDDEHPGGRCLAPNRRTIERHPEAPARWRHPDPSCEPTGEEDWLQPVNVVLTTAHLCQDSRCDDLEHLRALCQRCHLRLDRIQHAASARRARDAKRGQGSLSLEGGAK